MKFLKLHPRTSGVASGVRVGSGRSEVIIFTNFKITQHTFLLLLPGLPGTSIFIAAIFIAAFSVTFVL